MITSTLSFYPCLNPEETAAFYTEVVGLSLIMREENQCVLGCGRGNIGFVRYGDDVLASGHICISFNCESRDDVDAEFERLKKAGVPVKSAPAKHPVFPVYSFFFEDPNGYTVEFQKIDSLSL